VARGCLAGDSNFNFFFVTGNGTYDGKLGGQDFSDTVAKFALQSAARFHWRTGLLRTTSFMTPTTTMM
jgi:hypothetical protein